MLLLDAEKRTRETILDHYDVLLIELLGVKASGLSLERIEELIEKDLLSPDVVRGLDLADLDEPINPILFLRIIGTPYAEADSQTKALMRQYTLDNWKEFITPALLEPNQEPNIQEIDFNRPDLEEGSPETSTIPTWLSPSERAGLLTAFKSAGSFIRGLGNAHADEASRHILEIWKGEEIKFTRDPIKRQDALDKIRSEVGSAVLTNETASELATRLRNSLQDYSRNFQRIAETELQATHNEGQVYTAVYLDGEDARIARIPETGACKYCTALFLDKENKPKIFKVSEIIKNGSNVGRKRENYKASIYPIHPKCRCDTIPVGAQQTVNEYGEIETL